MESNEAVVPTNHAIGTEASSESTPLVQGKQSAVASAGERSVSE
jgi:hypothetical protein